MKKIIFAIALALAIASQSAVADLISSGGGSYDAVPLYRTLNFWASGDFSSNNIGGVDYASNIAPLPLSNRAASNTSPGGASFTSVGQAAWSGFYAGRNYASISVNNINSTETYYQVAGTGSATSMQFFTPSAAADHAIFTWHVSGTESNPAGVGRTTGRLDFGATTDSDVSWLNLFDDPTDKLNSITEFGPGTYSYSLPIADLGTLINIFYWSSAFAQINPGDAPQGSNATLTANYSNTFFLESVDLLNGSTSLDNWTLKDMNTNTDVFNQNGRLVAIDPAQPLPTVPGPAAIVLLATGFLGFAVSRRKTTQTYPQ